MFEGIRKHSESFVLVILIVGLAGIFVTQFGPGYQALQQGRLAVNHVARVYGTTIPEQDFQSIARLTGLSQRRDQRAWRQAIVDGLVERELLAHEAERLGFRISEDDMNKEIRDGYYYVSLGTKETDQIGAVPARNHTDYARAEVRNPEDGPPAFNYDDFENWVRSLYGRTVPDYKKLMEREMLAERMREVVTANVRVGEDEVWRDYQRQHNQVSVRYVAFSPEFYRETVRTDDQAAIDAFAREHQTEINQAWESRRDSLKGLPAQVRLRQILIRYPDNADDAARAATLARANYVRGRIAGNQDDFARMARLYSQDDDSWRSGGEGAWVSADRVDLPEDVKRALTNLQPGQLSDAITSPLGVYLIQVVGRRQGDVAEADAKAEIARDMFRLTRGKELAQAAASRGQQLLLQPNATLDGVAATMHTEGLTAFYHGEVPGPVQLPNNTTLEAVSHTDVGAPELRETQSFTSGGTVADIENSEPLVAAAFQLTEQNPAPAMPVAVGDDRYLIRLKDRQQASRDDFTRERGQLMESATLAKRREALQLYLTRLRSAAERDGQVKIGNSPLIQQQREPNQTGDREPAGTG